MAKIRRQLNKRRAWHKSTYLQNRNRLIWQRTDLCWSWRTGREQDGLGVRGWSVSQSVQSLSHVRLFATPWTAARQASLSITNSRSLHKPMSIVSVIPSNHLILCRPLLLPPSIFPSIRVFSNESALCIRWPKYQSFSFNISPSNEHLGLISFRKDWLDLLAVQGTLKSSPTPQLEIQTITFRMDKQQSPYVLIYTRKYIQYPLISHNGKEYKKRTNVYSWVTSLYSRDWDSIINQLYFTLKKEFSV